MSEREKPFVVLFEDAHVVAVDKPAGLLAVPMTSGGGKNVADLVRRAYGGATPVVPVHRIDRDTSGVMLFARTPQAEERLLAAFRERAVEKRYRLLSNHVPNPKKGTRQSFIVDRGNTATSSPRPVAGGRTAITQYEVLEEFRDAAHVEAMPLTGRFNQIRLHFADLHCPLIGERKYAVASRCPFRWSRPLLHAHALTFPHPASGKRVTVTSPLPADFEEFLARLRGR